MMEGITDVRSQLVVEICSVSLRFASCNHRRSNPRKPVFVDWYLILRVDEDAGLDMIRRRYRKLALQLHPDKNKHPKAEIAFKLVSEGYAILSDQSKRRAFNFERWSSFCKECSKKPSSFTAESEKPRRWCDGPTKKARPWSYADAVKEEARAMFKEETKVMESCLRVYGSSRKDYPVFNPSPLHLPGYPHCRTQLFCSAKGLWCFNKGGHGRYFHGGGKYESPVYEFRGEHVVPNAAKSIRT